MIPHDATETEFVLLVVRKSSKEWIFSKLDNPREYLRSHARHPGSFYGVHILNNILVSSQISKLLAKGKV